MKAILFDLDDTLYPEIEFVRSGFRTVARYLSSRGTRDEEWLVNRMFEVIEAEGRGRIFDRILHDEGKYSPELVHLLVYLYRSHEPSIEPFEEVSRVFKLLRERGLRLGIVTDGMATVQRRKIQALGLGPMVDTVVCTDELGDAYWKPSTVPFLVALQLLEVEPEEATYVGDDPQKDFVAPKELQMLTVQVRRLPRKERIDSKPGRPVTQADVTIATLDELPALVV